MDCDLKPRSLNGPAGPLFYILSKSSNSNNSTNSNTSCNSNNSISSNIGNSDTSDEKLGLKSEAKP